MYENYDQIKDRMLKTAARQWGGKDYISEAAFDPLVSMLLGACASELEKISNEIDESRLRVTEKLIDLMVPDVNAGVLPAHALVTGLPIEQECLVKPDNESFSTMEGAQEGNGALSFSPAGNFKLIRGSVAGMLHRGGLIRTGSQQGLSEMFRLRNSPLPAADELWLQFRFPDNAVEIKDLGVYFNLRSSGSGKKFYYLLRNSSWYAAGRPVEKNTGFSRELNQDDLFPGIFGGKAYKYHESLLHIRKLYEEQFMTIQLQQEQLKAGVPEEYKLLETEVPEAVAKAMASEVWVKVCFPQAVSEEIMRELSCSINTFPVANINKASRIFMSRRHLNLFSLRDEEFFFDLDMVEDENGRVYRESQADRVADVEEDFYILRGDGVESFDSRKAHDHINYLIEKLKNESASFNFLDKLTFNSDLKTLNQIMSRLEMNSDTLPSLSSPFYLYLNSRKENVSIFIQYRTTAGDRANGLKPSTLLQLYAGTQLQQGSMWLVTPTRGGRSKMSREERMFAYKKALLTRDRIVSEEDVKVFCQLQFGKMLKKIDVKKGVHKDFSSNGGFVRTIDLYIDLQENYLNPSSDIPYLCKDLILTLEEKSTGVFPYRIFINNELIEA